MTISPNKMKYPALCVALIAALALGVVTTPGIAHHSHTATYDDSRGITLEGPVTRIDWVNPHAYLFIDVEDSNGNVVNWALEFGNILDPGTGRMERRHDWARRRRAGRSVAGPRDRRSGLRQFGGCGR